MIMKNNVYIILVVFFAFIISSCEKVIDIDLNNAEPRIVVEAQMLDRIGHNYVRLSKTNDFYSLEESTMIKGALVEITDDNGSKFVLHEIEDGLYNNSTLKAEENINYKLNIVIGKDKIESHSTTASPVKIDSLKIEDGEFRKGGNDEEVTNIYKVTCYFVDPIDEINYYRLRILVNGAYLSEFYVVSDDYFNGKTIPYSFGGVELYENDKVTVQLMGIDEANYIYYNTIAKLNGNGQSITPGNPPTNLIGNAIGIFGSSTFDNMSEVFVIDGM